MKVYQFPRITRKLKKKKKQEPTLQDDTDVNLSKESLDDIMQELEGWVKDQDNPAQLIDTSEIDEALFKEFFKSFPCLKNYVGKTSQDVLAIYNAGELTDHQDIVVELIFELLSPYNFGFDLSEAFLALEKQDREAIIKVIDLYEKSLD